MKKLWQMAALAVLLWAGPAYGQQCKARPISGTGSGSSYAVFLNGERYSEHTTARRAVIQMEVLMEAEPLAQVVVMEYLWGIWQDNQKRDCAPRSARPPWPISLLPVVECPSCPPADTIFRTDTLTLTDTITVHDTVTVDNPVTEAALDACLTTLGICSADLGAALAEIERLLALPPPPPDTVKVPCDCDTVPEPPPPPPDTTTPPPPPPSGDVAWGIGSRPSHPPDGVWVQGMTEISTRVDWGIGPPESDMGYEVTWPGGRMEVAVQTWIDLPEAIAPTDTVCVAPGPIGGPYDQGLGSCHSYWP